MNKKGAWPVVQIVFVGIICGAAPLSAFLSKDSFRLKKALEICIQNGESQQTCEDKFKASSKAEILAFIKDNPTPLTTNFTHR